jgi:hypothetical protein
MTDAIVPSWHGNNYQSRIFWENAFNLLNPDTCVVEVTFEANGPKAFDDVVVRYDPPIPRSCSSRVAVDYHQVKWHMDHGGRFGFEDLVNPEFIGAATFSLLQRLQQAQVTSQASANFSFITTYRIKDGDPLSSLISANDKFILLERLFDGTTDRSKMGRIRKLWRTHLNLENDEDLRAIISGLRIFDGHYSLDQLRDSVNLKAKALGLATYHTNSDFRYDELARSLKARRLNRFTKDQLIEVLNEEGLIVQRVQEKSDFLSVAIQSFLGPAAQTIEASIENTLLLNDDFRQRYLRDDLEWQADIRPKVEDFLASVISRSSRLRLTLNAHASIAFFAGFILHSKSGINVELVQKGQAGTTVWTATDGSEISQTSFTHSKQTISTNEEIVLAISVTQDVQKHVAEYASKRLPNVGTVVHFGFPNGPTQTAVAGGGHALELANHVCNTIRNLKFPNPDALVHIFAACPNSFLFFLGQQFQSFAPCIVYEFDFDRKGNKTYQPSFHVE